MTFRAFLGVCSLVVVVCALLKDGGRDGSRVFTLSSVVEVVKSRLLWQAVWQSEVQTWGKTEDTVLEVAFGNGRLSICDCEQCWDIATGKTVLPRLSTSSEQQGKSRLLAMPTAVKRSCAWAAVWISLLGYCILDSALVTVTWRLIEPGANQQGPGSFFFLRNLLLLASDDFFWCWLERHCSSQKPARISIVVYCVGCELALWGQSWRKWFLPFTDTVACQSVH